MSAEDVDKMPEVVIATQVGDFYDRLPYPPPVDDIAAYRRNWNDARRRAESYLFCPSQPYQDERSILVAGCGTMQAAHYAARWPQARVTGIDVSANSVAYTQALKRQHALDNLTVHRLPVERAAELGEVFEHVVSTGVIHHLPDPDAGLSALRAVLAPHGALHMMVYAPYGRAGIYLLQDYCRRLGIGSTAPEIEDLAATLKALPPDHPLAPLLRESPDFTSMAGLADALLHPVDRSYSVPQLFDFLQKAGLRFGRFLRQAPYLPWCGALRSTPHFSKLAELRDEEQYAAIELFRGSMVRHSVVAYRSDNPARAIDFESDVWKDYRPMRLPDTVTVRDRDRVPPGATAVLINRNHTFNDLYLPIDAAQDHMLRKIDGRRTLAEIAMHGESDAEVIDFARTLWRWDQIVFDTSPQKGVADVTP